MDHFTISDWLINASVWYIWILIPMSASKAGGQQQSISTRLIHGYLCSLRVIVSDSTFRDWPEHGPSLFTDLPLRLPLHVQRAEPIS